MCTDTVNRLRILPVLACSIRLPCHPDNATMIIDNWRLMISQQRGFADLAKAGTARFDHLATAEHFDRSSASRVSAAGRCGASCCWANSCSVPLLGCVGRILFRRRGRSRRPASGVLTISRRIKTWRGMACHKTVTWQYEWCSCTPAPCCSTCRDQAPTPIARRLGHCAQSTRAVRETA